MDPSPLLSDYHYDLPPDRIATHPARRRDQSRLMRLSRADGRIEHHIFSELPTLLRPGDCLVINDSRVLAARLWAGRPGGGRAEILLVEPRGEGVWEALARPGRRFRPGLALTLEGGGRAILLERASERSWLLRLKIDEPLESYLERAGEMPLPPYILQQRKAKGEAARAGAEDRERYQTVYARQAGSIAAPTAGLHFTPELLAELARREIQLCRVTLHVGLGTFEPILAERVEEHRMHAERWRIEPAEAEAIEAARRDPERRVIAVGTTAARTLESCAARHGGIRAAEEMTDIFIRPGHRFLALDALVTNFHLPGSTLLMLVAALAGREPILRAYREAVNAGYRFFSYGDAMLID